MRRDFYCANDSGGLSVLSSGVVGRVVEDGRAHDDRFVKAHEGRSKVSGKLLVAGGFDPDALAGWREDT